MNKRQYGQQWWKEMDRTSDEKYYMDNDNNCEKNQRETTGRERLK